MKHIPLFLILLFFSACSLRAQQTNTYTFTFSQNDFDFKIEDNKTYIIPHDNDFSFDQDVTAPAIPMKNVQILIAKDQTYVSHSSYKTSQKISNTTELAPNPEVVPTNSFCSIKQANVQIPTYQYSSYPSQNVIYNGEHEVEGYKVLSFTIIPFKYFTSNHYLYLYNNLSLSVTTAHTDSINNNHSLIDKPFIRALAYNGNDIDLLYGTPDPQPTPDYEYLIITNNYLKPAFQPLANWKTIKGVRTKVLTTEDIDSYSLYSAPTKQERILNAIIDYHNGAYHGLKYVLLAGDDTIVPSQKCWICTKTTEPEECPADIFYSSYESWWDSNHDGIFGDSIDNFKLNPLIAVTRIPASSLIEASAFVQRIIQYESNPDTTNWNNSILMCGKKVGTASKWFEKYNEDGTLKSDSQQYGDAIYNIAIAPFWIGSLTRFYDSYSDVGDGSYMLNSYNLSTEICKNYSFLNVITHGDIDRWCLDKITPNAIGDDYYLTSNAYNSSFPLKTIILTSACFTNAFDSNNKCLGAGFMCNPYGGGALGYIGSSRFGFATYNMSSSSDQFNKLYYENLFTGNNHHFGDVFKRTQILYIKRNALSNWNSYYYFNNRNTGWYLALSTNALGDPEMPIFTETPLPIDPNTIFLHFNENTLYVSTTLDSVTICVTSIDDSGVAYFSKQENVSNAIFERMLGSYNVCITKPGYIPFLKTVHNNLYIQNKQLSFNKSYEAEKVYIGKNVTAVESEGDVTINSNGNISINAHETYIKNNFEVKSGGVLTIEPK